MVDKIIFDENLTPENEYEAHRLNLQEQGIPIPHWDELPEFDQAQWKEYTQTDKKGVTQI